MHLLARAMRGPVWLAWLSLLFAAQVAAGDAIAGSERDDSLDGFAVHASTRPRPRPVLASAAGHLNVRNHDELAPSPAVAAATLSQPLTNGSRPVRKLFSAGDSALAFVHLSPRAPPLSRSL